MKNNKKTHVFPLHNKTILRNIESHIIHILYILYTAIFIVTSYVIRFFLFFVKYKNDFAMKDSVCQILHSKKLINDKEYEDEHNFAKTINNECLLGYSVIVAPIIPILKSRDTINECVRKKAVNWFKHVKLKSLYFKIALKLNYSVGVASFKIAEVLKKRIIHLFLPHILMFLYILQILVFKFNILSLLCVISIIYLYTEVSSQFFEIKINGSRSCVYSAIIVWILAYMATLYASFQLPIFTSILNCVLLVFISSTFGFVVGHELCHKKGTINILLSKIMLFICMYPHFYEAHNKLHHRHLGTSKDPTSASNSTSIYKHLWKQLVYYVSYANKLTLLFWIVSIFILSFNYKVGISFILFGFLNWFMLELINFLQHLGLKRKCNEPINYNSSYETHNPFTNIVCFNLGKHSDHHIRARKWHCDLEFKGDFYHKEGYLMQALLFLKPHKR